MAVSIPQNVCAGYSELSGVKPCIMEAGKGLLERLGHGKGDYHGWELNKGHKVHQMKPQLWETSWEKIKVRREKQEGQDS